jgi:hypothetical protein
VNAFRAAVESRDLAAMEAALHPDVVFRSPAVFKPYEGREAVMHLLSTVVQVFEDFQYTDELDGEGTHALVFRARVGDRQIEGLDHLTLDDDGLVTQLVVMVRPLSGLMAVAEAMAQRLGRSEPVGRPASP